MSRARLDLEKDKFDAQGRVKVALDNTSSDPLPVEIINADSAIDVEVSIPDQITIDDSTPIDVNVTNASVNTNATIQNASIDVNLTDLDINSRLPVSVDNQPTVTVDDSTPIDTNITNASINTNATIQGTPSVTVSGDVGIDDATAIRVDVTNASIATNATIQNAELDVNVTNPFQYVYDMVYDGSQWRFQLSDTNGKAINLDHTYYTSTEITALGSSTDINLWLAAYNDSMLQYKYVGSYDDEFEVEVYLTHPDLGDGNKCLKLIFDYSTQNTKKVVKSVYASIVDWTFDASITGALTLTLGTVTSPDPNSAIAVGTDICTIAVSNSGSGSVTISLSGLSASLYTLRNVTDAVTGSSLDYDSADSYVLETASDFSGASYSHSLTITATNNLYGNTDSENVATSGSYTGQAPWSNDYHYQGPGTAATSNVSDTGVYGNTTISAWNTNSSSPINTFRTTNNVSFSFWVYIPSTVSASHDFSIFSEIVGYKSVDIVFRSFQGAEIIQVWECNGGTTRNYRQITTGFNLSAWNHVIINFGGSTSTTMGVANASIYVNNSSVAWAAGSTTSTCTASGSNISKTCIGGGKAYNSAYADHSGGESSFKIDELCLFNGTLTSTDVSTLYNGGQTFDITTASLSTGVTLQRYFRFGDGTDSESTLKDYSGLGDGFEFAKNSIITDTKLIAY